MGSLAKRIAAQRAFFNRDRTKPLAFRLAMLGRLETRIREQEDAILAALRLDLSKSRAEAYMTELALVYGELREARRKLRIWARTERPGKELYLPGTLRRSADTRTLELSLLFEHCASHCGDCRGKLRNCKVLGRERAHFGAHTKTSAGGISRFVCILHGAGHGP